MTGKFSFLKTIQRYFFTGILTAIPLLVTWLLVDFLLDLLRAFGEPAVRWISLHLQGFLPGLSAWLMKPWFQATVAVVLVLLVLVVTGWLATRHIGRKFLAFFDSMMDRLPMVRNI
jgi:uncharacterized membrane protein